MTDHLQSGYRCDGCGEVHADPIPTIYNVQDKCPRCIGTAAVYYRLTLQKFDMSHPFIETGRCWIYACIDGQVIGALSYYVERSGDWVWIPQIFIQEPCRRLGIASTMLEYLLSQPLADSVKGYAAGVNRKNYASRSLFEKHGFRHVMTYEDDGSLMYSRPREL